MWNYILNDGESDCCGAPVWENQDICQKCKEHCGVIYEEDGE